jgi:hypothetical protein
MWRRADLIRDRITECEAQLGEARAVGHRGSEARLLRELAMLRADLAHETQPARAGRRRDDDRAGEPAPLGIDGAAPSGLSVR